MTKTSDYPRLEHRHLNGSSLRQFHLTGDPGLTKALATIPGYVDVRRKLVAIGEYQPEAIEPPTDPMTAMTAVIEAALAAGEPIPPRLTDEIPPDRDQIRHLNQLAAQARDTVKAGLAGRLDELLLTNLRKVYGWIEAAVVEAVTEARAIQARGDRPATAEEAIAADRVEDFKAVQRIERAYSNARVRQVELVQQDTAYAITHVDGRAGAFRLFLANPIEALGMDDVRKLADGGTQLTSGDGWVHTDPVPANWLAGETVWWFGSHPDAEPWVPTSRQYSEQHQAIIAELNAVTPAQAKAARERQRALDASMAQHRTAYPADF